MRLRHLFGLSISIIACGGKATPPQTTTLTPTPTSTITTPTVFDVSPVEAPKSIALTVRVANARALAERVERWTHIPISPEEIIGNSAAAEIADLTLPIDVAVAIDDARNRPDEYDAISAAVRSIEQAKQVLGGRFELIPGTNGVVQLKAKTKSDKHSEDNDDDEMMAAMQGGEGSRPCVLAPAYDAAPKSSPAYRIICADNQKTLIKLAPYLARTVTRMPIPGDIHATANTMPFRSLVTSLRTRGTRGTTAPLVDLISAYDPFEFALDTDSGTIDLKFDEQGIDASLSVIFRDSRSAITQAITSHPEKADAPPASFLRLPIDCDLAIFSHGFDSSELERMRVSAPEALLEELKNNGLENAEATLLGNAFRNSIASLSGPIVYARGVDVEKSAAALDVLRATKGKPIEPKVAQAAFALLAGWEIFGVDQPIAKVGTNIKEYAAAIGRPGFAKWQKGRTGVGLYDFRSGDHSSGETPITTFKSAAAFTGLPADSLHFELSIAHSPVNMTTSSSAAKGTAVKKSPVVFTKWHIAVIPDQGHTWIIDGMDEATILARAKGILSGTADSTLAKKTGIEIILTNRSNAGGFTNARGVGMPLPLSWAHRSPYLELGLSGLDSEDPLGGMKTAADGGKIVPITITEQAPPSGFAGALTVKTRVSKDAIVDFLVVGKNLF